MNAITGDLFAMPARRVETPIARRSDPASSHLAAGEITASGTRAHQQAQAIAMKNCRTIFFLASPGRLQT